MEKKGNLIYVESPEYPDLWEESWRKQLFLAGGITECLDWQSYVVERLANNRSFDGIVYNPRRADFPIEDQSAAVEQIEWEYKFLNQSDYYFFWFAKETLQPIALYELGRINERRRWDGNNVFQFIGIHPKYPRRKDVIIQTRLIYDDQDDIEFHDSLDETIDAFLEFNAFHKFISDDDDE